MAVGRTNQPRVVSVTTSSSSKNLTAGTGTFNEEDAGRPISGNGISPGTTIATVTSDTAAVLSANASGSATVNATLGGDSAASYGFSGWSPETDAESEVYSIAGGAGANDPARITDNTTGWGSKRRSRTTS